MKTLYRRFEDWVTHPDGKYRIEILAVLLIIFVSSTITFANGFQKSIYDYDSFFGWVSRIGPWLSSMQQWTYQQFR